MFGGNPFSKQAPASYGIECLTTFGVVDRLEAVKGFSADECRAVIALASVQVTVRKAAERRLRKLEKQ